MNEIVLRTNKGEYSPGEEICGYAKSGFLLLSIVFANFFKFLPLLSKLILIGQVGMTSLQVNYSLTEVNASVFIAVF